MADEAPVVLSERQGQVLQALVSSFVGGAAPVASETISALIPRAISSASVRNTLAELTELGLVAKPHRSAGRIPTETGFRVFLDQLFQPPELGPYEKRDLEGALDPHAPGGLSAVASRVLSERTRQLGFVLAPRLDGVVVRHISFVRLSTERVLCVLVSKAGRAYQRVLAVPGMRDQADLDALARALGERVVGRTLAGLREVLVREASALRSHAERLLDALLEASARLPELVEDTDVVIATRLALLDQPEFRDPERLRDVLGALEQRGRLVEVVDGMLQRGARVALGSDIGEPALRDCAVVVAPYGGPGSPLGSIGVIGPRRMDYARVVPLVGYISNKMTEFWNS